MPRAKERNEHIVYLIENVVNGKVYVGKTGLTTTRRFSQHKSNALNANLPGLLYNAIRKHGGDKFTIRELGRTSSEFINMLETLYILIFNANKRQVGYNLTTGGDGGRTRMGATLTDEQKARIGEANKGRKWTPEQREVLMAARRKQGDERRGSKRPDLAGKPGPMKEKKHRPESVKKMLETKLSRGLMRDLAQPKPKKVWKPIERTEEFWTDLRRRQSEITKAYMANNPPSTEARLKMKLASQKYWAEVKAQGGVLSNASRTKG